MKEKISAKIALYAVFYGTPNQIADLKRLHIWLLLFNQQIEIQQTDKNCMNSKFGQMVTK